MTRHVACRGGDRHRLAVQSQADAIERFVRSGGGLVLAGPSVHHRRFARLPWVRSARERPVFQAADTMRLG
jgi:hypothetical protein